MKNQTPPKDLYQQITDQIIEALEQGVMPWQKPWDSGWPQMAIPCNGESGRQYSGINVLLLWMSAIRKNFTQRKWVTFQGANHLGGQVRTGEKSTVIIFYKQNMFEEKENKPKDEWRNAEFEKKYILDEMTESTLDEILDIVY